MASIFSTVRDLERLRQIVAVLGRHGFGEIIQRTGLGSLVIGKDENGEALRLSLGERILRVLTDLGPSAIKLGQILSTRPDLIPEEVIAKLKTLQDNVPPVPFSELKPHLEESLGGTIDEVYESFSETPLASASIGQVHRAMLRHPDGPIDVVVKIQRPKIQDTIERDIDLLYWLARAVERSIPESRTYAPVRLVAEFERAISAELDFNLEADHALRFTKNFEGHEQVKFPAVYREASSKRVLTLEFLPGKKIYDAIEAGHSGELISRLTLGVIIKQIFEDGFFHADPHPGNVFILGTPEKPILAFIDLGLVGRLTPQMRDRTIDLMVAVAREDKRAVADALYAIGKPTKKINRDEYEAEVSALADRYLGKPLKDIEISSMIRDFVHGSQKYGLEIPPDFLMVGKTLMTVEGVGKEIYPDLDVFGEMNPYFLNLFWQRYSPEKMGQDLLRLGTKLSGAAADLPLQIQEVLDDLRKGQLVIKTNEQSIGHAYDRLGRRMYSGFVVAASMIGGAMLLAQKELLLGLLFLAFAALWGSGHMGLLMFLKKKD